MVLLDFFTIITYFFNDIVSKTFFLERDLLYSEWKKGIERSLDWDTDVKGSGMY